MSHHPSAKAKPVLPAQPAPPPHGTHICANSATTLSARVESRHRSLPFITRRSPVAAGDSPIQARGILPFDGARLASQAPGGEGDPPNCRDATRKPQQAASILQLGGRYGENGPHAHEIVSDDKCRRENCTHWVIFKFFLHKLHM